MMLESVNVIGVIAATIASIIIGFLWYGPLFGKTWAKEQGWSDSDMEAQKSKGMGKSYGLMTLGSLLTAYVLAQFAKATGSVTSSDGVSLGFMVWLGFAVPLLLGSILWEGKSTRLYAINVGYQLVTFIAMGMIVTIWG